MEQSTNPSRRPLDGIRVIELGQLIAGPFASSMLAYFGAEVIKIESPKGGDPIRGWRSLDGIDDGCGNSRGTSYWWRSIGRNKKSVTLDLKLEQGRDLARQLIDSADVVVENFRPGVMEKWGLGPEQFKQSNPGLVYARISGYGQDGPYAKKPGFASVCEGISGFRYVNGFPDQAPVRPNLSIGDTIAGIHAALGIVMALFDRQQQALESEDGTGCGQVVDVALYEAMFNLMEAVVPEYSGAEQVRQPSGTTVTGIVPTNTYRCGNGKYVVIGGNGDSIFARLMQACGRDDLAEDPRLAHNAGRVEHEAEIDTVLSDWCRSKASDELLSILEQARVPAGPIYSVEDMFEDEHFRARGMFEQVTINGKPLEIPAMSPRLSDTPGRTDYPGQSVGEETESVLADVLGLAENDIASLKEQGVI